MSLNVCCPRRAILLRFYAGGFKPAVYYLAHLERLKASRQPFQFIVSRAMPDGRVLFSNNIKVSLEDYTITENAKSGFDVQVKIRLKQYKDFGTLDNWR